MLCYFQVYSKVIQLYMSVQFNSVAQSCPTLCNPRAEGDQPWVFLGRNDAKAETPVLWPPHAKS